MVFQCAAIILALLYLCGGAEWNIVDEKLVNDFRLPEVAAQKTTVVAQGLDSMLGTKTWRTVVFFSMLASLWLTFGITLLSGLDYSIHAARMIRKQRERMRELEELGIRR
jgi:hypothetical protein